MATLARGGTPLTPPCRFALTRLNRSEFSETDSLGHPSVTGLDNPLRAAFGVSASPASARVRSWDVATMGGSCRFRHRDAGRRRTSIPRAFSLMTESACESSTRCAPARCILASVRATMRRREPSRFDVEHPSTRRERTPDSAAVKYPAMVRQPAEGVVHMLGEQSTSVSDRIQGEWETCEVSRRVTQPRRVARGGPPLGARIHPRNGSIFSPT